MMAFRFSAQVIDDFIVIEVGGELDYGSVSSFRERVLRVIEQYGRRIVVDLTDLDFMDSSGLGALVSLWRRAGESGGSLRVANPNSSIARMFRWTGLERRLPIFPDVSAALSAP